jgi:guanylate kinase
MSFQLVVLQGPSASGKTTLQARLGLPRIVTWTSRPPRAGETEGRDYYFGSREKLQGMYDGGELLEISDYQGNLYGTSLASVAGALQDKTARSVVLDASGAQTVKDRYPEQVLRIGIYADKEQCRKRLSMRGASEEEMDRRLAGYEAEVQQLFSCDLIIPNNDKRLEQADGFMQWIRGALTQPWD